MRHDTFESTQTKIEFETSAAQLVKKYQDRIGLRLCQVQVLLTVESDKVLTNSSKDRYFNRQIRRNHPTPHRGSSQSITKL